MKAIVSLGSNIEPRREYLARAIDALKELDGTDLERVSAVEETEPVDVPSEFASQKFLNQVAIFETKLDALSFSNSMHAIESQLGRMRTVIHGPRTIDIDLIAFGDIELNDASLTLPHPRAMERSFVMVPLQKLYLEDRTKAAVIALKEGLV